MSITMEDKKGSYTHHCSLHRTEIGSASISLPKRIYNIFKKDYNKILFLKIGRFSDY